MSFFRRLFGKGQSSGPRGLKSTRPEDYDAIFLRWNPGGKEYGPLKFSDLLTRKWSKPPMQGRFLNESHWHQYEDLLRLIDKLNPSEEQLAMLNKKGLIAPDERVNYRTAVSRLDRAAEEGRARRASERAEKEGLPATAYMRKKMDGLGIKYSKDVTRLGAKRLLEEHAERQAIASTLDKLAKAKIEVPEEIFRAVERSNPSDNTVVDELDEFLEIIEQLGKLHCLIPSALPASVQALRELNGHYYRAIDEAETTESELEEKQILVGNREVRLVGALPKTGMRA